MRTLAFDRIENARELGGIPVSDGRSIRAHRLIRSGNLSLATDADIEILTRVFKLSDVVDFRFPAEAGKDPDRIIPGVRYTSLSTLPQKFIDGFSQGRSEAGQLSSADFAAALVYHASNPEAQELARQLYPGILSNPASQERYGEFLRIVLNAEGGVLWHCSQGKDRAGLAAAFVLTALGASFEEILADFDESNVSYTSQINVLCKRVEDLGGGEGAKDFIRAMVGVSKPNFLQAMAWINETYGSLLNYVEQALSFGPEQQKQLKDKYLR